jgi:hypothetical protein
MTPLYQNQTETLPKTDFSVQRVRRPSYFQLSTQAGRRELVTPADPGTQKGRAFHARRETLHADTCAICGADVEQFPDGSERGNWFAAAAARRGGRRAPKEL